MDGLYIGLMSGTSTDAVDAVLVKFSDKNHPTTLGFYSQPFPNELRQTLLQLNSPQHNDLHLAALASVALAKEYAHCVNTLLLETGISADEIIALGVHGQTVRHRPELGYTLQLNAPALIAELTKIATIADFRSRDIAAGGQGAPLVPAFHHALFAQTDHSVAILNLGGIANVSLVMPDHVLGFDTGPANMLMDMWVEQHTGQRYDHNGEFAAQGVSQPDLLRLLIDSEPWFQLAPPKSTGRDVFNSAWLTQRLSMSPVPYRPQDVQATLLSLTVKTALEAIQRASHKQPASCLYICGGGALNPRLLAAFKESADCPVHTTQALGVPVMQMEALAFAWLAYKHMRQEPANFPSVTGAAGPRILGAYYPA